MSNKSINGKITDTKCKACNGSGSVTTDGIVDEGCPTCFGKGYLTQAERLAEFSFNYLPDEKFISLLPEEERILFCRSCEHNTGYDFGDCKDCLIRR